MAAVWACAQRRELKTCDAKHAVILKIEGRRPTMHVLITKDGVKIQGELPTASERPVTHAAKLALKKGKGGAKVHAHQSRKRE